MRILIRAGIYSFSYPYTPDFLYKVAYKLIKDLFKDYNYIKVILFDNLQKEHEWSKNANINPNICKINDLLL